MKKPEIIFGAMRLPVDYLATICAFLFAYYLRPITDLIPGVQFYFGPELLPPFNEYLSLSAAAAGFLIILFSLNHLYSLKIINQIYTDFLKIIFLVTTWLMFIIAYYFLVVHELFFSRIALAHIWLFSILFIIFGRLIIGVVQKYLLKFNIGKRRILFIGANEIADRFYQSIKEKPSYEIIGALSDHIYSRKKEQIKIIGQLKSFEEIIDKYKIEEVIQTDPDLKMVNTTDLYAFCRNNQIKYHFIPDLIRLQHTNVEIQTIDNIPLVSLKESALDGWGYVLKRVFDLVFSLIFIIVLIPLWILIPLLIKIDSKGSVIYKSNRKYKNKVFGIYKFRSMVSNADELKKELMKENERKGPLFKIKKDPRITRIGAFLRKTSIDELPQLFNVLKGDLSLVGPRPHLPEEINQYKSHHHRVFAIKPGLTGLAQISGRSHINFEEEVRLDVYYIENWSLWLDISIILKSVLVMLKANGA